MKNIKITTILIVLVLILVAVGYSSLEIFTMQEKNNQEKKIGYDDTPIIPGTKWHVHDGDRPQPQIVTPGTSDSEQGKPPSDAIILFDGEDLCLRGAYRTGCVNESLCLRDDWNVLYTALLQGMDKLQGTSCPSRIQNNHLVLLEVGCAYLGNETMAACRNRNHENIRTFDAVLNLARCPGDRAASS